MKPKKNITAELYYTVNICGFLQGEWSDRVLSTMKSVLCEAGIHPRPSS